jgi:hypothetical protein
MKKLLLTILLSGSALAQIKKPVLEEVAQFAGNLPIGVAVQQNTNRLFVSFPHNEPFLYAVTEIVDGKRVPFPDDGWNKYTPAQPEANHFYNAQDMYADDQNNLWILDSKPAGSASVFGADAANEKAEGKFKLIKVNLTTNTVERVYKFGGLPKDKSGLNDVRIDTKRQLAYLSDPALKAIVVLDLKTDIVRIVLEGHPSTIAEPDYILKIDGIEMKDDKGKPFSSNINGIALSKDNKYFYYKPINKDRLYKIQTKFLADTKLSAEDLAKKVEIVANTGVTHGLESDSKGNIYFGHSPSHSIKYVNRHNKVNTLVMDGRIIWPDSFGVGSNGYLYFSAAQLNKLPKYNEGLNRVEYPYRVYRVRMPK